MLFISPSTPIPRSLCSKYIPEIIPEYRYNPLKFYACCIVCGFLHIHCTYIKWYTIHTEYIYNKPSILHNWTEVRFVIFNIFSQRLNYSTSNSSPLRFPLIFQQAETYSIRSHNILPNRNWKSALDIINFPPVLSREFEFTVFILHTTAIVSYFQWMGRGRKLYSF